MVNLVNICLCLVLVEIVTYSVNICRYTSLEDSWGLMDLKDVVKTTLREEDP